MTYYRAVLRLALVLLLLTAITQSCYAPWQRTVQVCGQTVLASDQSAQAQGLAAAMGHQVVIDVDNERSSSPRCIAATPKAVAKWMQSSTVLHLHLGDRVELLFANSQSVQLERPAPANSQVLSVQVSGNRVTATAIQPGSVTLFWSTGS